MHRSAARLALSESAAEQACECASVRAYSLIDGAARGQAAIGTHYCSTNKRVLVNKTRLLWSVSDLVIL